MKVIMTPINKNLVDNERVRMAGHERTLAIMNVDEITSRGRIGGFIRNINEDLTRSGYHAAINPGPESLTACATYFEFT